MFREDGDPLERLVDAFRGLLDDTLVAAIASDHDLSTKAGYESAEAILKGLSQDVALEEATGFNPNGSAGAVDGPDTSVRDDVSISTTSASQNTPHATRTDSSSTDLSSAAAHSTSSTPRLTTFNNDSDESKFLTLQGIFSSMKEFDIRHALKMANGDVQTALDSLLNVQYLRSTGQQPRGIDGFFEPEDTAPGPRKKRKGKGKQKPVTSQPFGLDPVNKEVLEKSQAKELKHQDEIAFLSERMNMPFDQVSDIYYRKKCSSGAAAAEIVGQYIALGISSEDEEGKKKAKILASQHSKIPEKYLLTLVQVTNPTGQSSDEIAALLSKHFAKHPWTERLNLSHRIAQLPDEELEGSAGAVHQTPGTRARAAQSSHKLPGAASRAATNEPVDLPQAIQNINDAHQARREAAAYASQLSRKGGSNALYRQAAVVYRERVNEHARQAQHMTSTAADLLVDRSSTKNSIDLHGVTVRDGVRIAKNRTQSWWDNLGEYRTRRAKEQPFIVITGLGRHSASGVSQLRQSVAAALLQDGWKVQIETGKFVISGRR